MKPRTKVLTLVALLLLMMVGGAGGAYWIYKRGKARSGMFQQAVAASDAGDLDKAEDLFRKILATKPDDARAFYRLMKMFAAANRMDDLEALCATWEAGDVHPQLSWRFRIDLYLNRGDFLRAVTESRELSARDPAQLQRVLLSTRSLSHALRDRAAAAENAQRLSDLSDSPFESAFALMQSGDILSEVASRVRPRAADASLTPETRAARIANADRLAATALERYNDSLRAVDIARSEEGGLGFEILREFLLLRLGADDAARTSALRGIKKHLDAIRSRNNKSDDRIASTIHLVRLRYELMRNLPSDARTAASELTEADPLSRLAAVRQFAIHDLGNEALSVFEELFPEPRSPFLNLHALSIALQAPKVDPAKPRVIAESIIAKNEKDLRLIGETLRMFADRGRSRDVIELIELALSKSPNVQLDVWLASALSAGPDTRASAEELIEKISKSEEMSTVQVLAFARQLALLDPDLLERYLDSLVLNETKNKERALFLRAAVRWERARRSKAEDDDAPAKEASLQDLRSVLKVDGQENGEVLEAAATLAIALGDFQLAGMLASEGLVVAGPLTKLPVKLIAGTRRTGVTQEDATNLATPMRQRASKSTRGPALLAFADCIENTKLTMQECVDRLQKVDGAPEAESLARYSATLLSLRLADKEQLTRNVSRLRELNPDDRDIRELYTLVLSRVGKWPPIVDALEDAENRSVPEYGFLIGAYREAKVVDEAVKAGEQAVREHPGDPRAYHLQCLVMLDTAKVKDQKLYDAVLAVAYASPDSRPIMLLRASLLIRRKNYARAESIYEDLLRTGPFDPIAMRDYAALLGEQARNAEVAQKITGYLNKYVFGDDSKVSETHPIVQTWRLLRAQALDRAGASDDALDDYEWVISKQPKNAVALNNGAWLLADRVIARRALNMDTTADAAKAKEWIDTALTLVTGVSNLLDTAAHVYYVNGEYPRALELIDEALALKAADRPSYRLRRARILVGLDRGEDALRVLDILKKKFPDSAEAKEADQLRLRLEEK